MKEARVKLNNPFTFGTKTINEVVIPPIKTKHLRGVNLQNLTMDDMLDLLGKVALLSDSEVDEIEANDLMRILEVLGDFLGGSQEIGNIQSA